MLRVTLLGNLGADPETRYSQKGTQVVSFRVAVNQVRTGRDGERQENTEWFRVNVTGRQTEFAQRLGKGSRVLIMGRLDISHYQGKDGEPRTGFDVWADDVQSMSTPGSRGFGADTEAPEAEQDSLEPAMAGVSSVAAPNGRPRASANRAAPPRAAAESSDLE